MRYPILASLLLASAGALAAATPLKISAADILARTKVLASDEFEGRAPGTPGEEKTVDYLVSEFQKLGLAPGNPDGTYIQRVPLVGIASHPTLSFDIGGKDYPMEPINDYVGPTSRVAKHLEVKASDVVFVGYGVVAPEFGWDDYKGIDCRGKTLVMLVNDPPVVDSATGKLDPKVFGGKAMTYYGRWTYKYEIAAQKHAAARRDFHPVELGASASFTIDSDLRNVDSRNVIAKLEGSDPKLKNEYVVYTAHWDHLGRDTRLKGDQIYNGAVDNASGVAVLLELAQAFVALPADQRPKRTLLFLSVTAEEKGLLGSRYYAQNPLYPLNRTLADINMDGANQFGPTSDMATVGFGASTIDDIGIAVAKEQGRTMEPEAHPERGSYYRSDHFEFAKVGVPSYYPKSGKLFIGKPADYGEQLIDDYIAHRYHKVADEVQPDWTFAGAAQDTEFLFEVGRRIADGDTWPQWRPGNEFKPKRDAMLKE